MASRRWKTLPARAARALAVLGLVGLAASPVRAARAWIQYHQGVDESMVQAVAQSLPPDRTLHFRYDPEFPDDHVFPNGLTMGQFHAWVAELINAWNQQPLMPLRLSVERDNPDAPNTIMLDEAGHDTGADPGKGGWGYEWLDSQHILFGCGAVINVSRGYNTTHELVEGTVKHELGHCLTLLHSVNRASVMAYLTQDPPWDADTGFFQLDDLLGIRAVWAREAPGFGALEGSLVYPNGSGVGGGDVEALDAQTGAVLASAFSDGSGGGRFRIELPAGRQIRLIAHPVHADQAIFGNSFIEKRDLTPDGFEPTEYMMSDRSASIVVPYSTRVELPPFVVTAAADPPLLNKDVEVTPMLPGERAHLQMHFKGLTASPPPQVSLTLSGLSADNVAASGDHVDFDVTASPDAVGVSGVEVRSGAAANFQVGRVWVRPADGILRATDVAPLLLPKGQTTEVLVQGVGLDRVTGVQVVKDQGSPATLPARLAGQTPDGSLRVQVDVPASGVVKGPWRLVLLTSDGEARRGSEPQPRLWVGRASLLTTDVVDGGDVILNQPARFGIPLKNVSSERIQVTNFTATAWYGDFKNWKLFNSPNLAPGQTGALSMQLTPTNLGPLIIFIESSTSKGLETVSEVRLWVVPKGGA